MVLALDHVHHKVYPRIHVQKTQTLKRVIAFFDFDGTVTRKDTLLEFIKFSKGSFRFYLGLILNSPILIAYKIGIVSNQTAKEWMLRYYFSGKRNEWFQQQSDLFIQQKLPLLLRPKAIKEIQKLQEAGADIVIVSASAENWIRKWTDSMKITLIGTRLFIKNERITGKIDGKNCHGKEKVRRIKEKYKLEDYTDIYCYGDTKGDKPMLELGTIKFYKPFR
jgi:phosphatidylglycerophosphatase C